MILIIIIIIISFMQGIHTYIPETNHVSTVYSVTAILRALLMVHIIIIIIIISFMQGIHTYMPQTNHVSRVYSVAAILRVLLMVHTERAKSTDIRTTSNLTVDTTLLPCRCGTHLQE
jgi:hypothetical protein